jgi:tetratricopeptide (TPR) repeat protein
MLPIEHMYENMRPLLQAARPEDAFQALRNVVRSFPDFAGAHHDIGMLYYRSGEGQKALGHLERAAHLEPGNATFLTSLADYYHVELSRVEDALALYVRILAIRPNDTTIQMTAAHLHVSLQRFAEAAVHYRRVLDVEPWNTEANENLAKIQQILGGAADRSGAEELYADAQRHAQGGDTAAARNRLVQLVAAHPGFAAAHNDLGVMCYQAGDKDLALRHYEQAARLEPGNGTFQKNLADFYWVEQSRTEDALKIYVRVLEDSPQDIEALTAVARVCAALGQREDARVFYERILELEPWNTDAHDALNQLRAPRSDSAAAAASPQESYEEAARLIAAGDTGAGRDRLREMVAAHPGFALPHNDLGVLAYQAGDRQEALERYENAARLEPSNMTFQKNLADCYWVGFGRYEDALKIYVDVLSAYPEDLETLHATGRLCQALGRPEDGRTFFERMLEIEPWNVEAGRELDRLAAASKAA